MHLCLEQGSSLHGHPPTGSRQILRIALDCQDSVKPGTLHLKELHDCSGSWAIPSHLPQHRRATEEKKAAQPLGYHQLHSGLGEAPGRQASIAYAHTCMYSRARTHTHIPPCARSHMCMYTVIFFVLLPSHHHTPQYVHIHTHVLAHTRL